MVITTKTIVSFRVPDDYKQEKIFVETNDMSEWVQHNTSSWVSYSQQRTYAVEEQKREEQE